MDAGRPGCRDLPRPDRAGSFAAHHPLGRPARRSRSARRAIPLPCCRPGRCRPTWRSRSTAASTCPPASPTISTGPQAGRERRRPAGSHARDPVAVERRPDRLAIRHRGYAGSVLRGRVPAAICPRPLSRGIVARPRPRPSPPVRHDQHGTTSIASILGLNAPAADWSINGIPANELSQWIKTGSQEISHLTSLGVEGVAKTLGLKGLKATPTASGLNLEAQYLVPPSAQASPGPLPVPAPEPAAWLVFGLILGAAGLRRRVDRRSRWTSLV